MNTTIRTTLCEREWVPKRHQLTDNIAKFMKTNAPAVFENLKAYEVILCFVCNFCNLKNYGIMSFHKQLQYSIVL